MGPSHTLPLALACTLLLASPSSSQSLLAEDFENAGSTQTGQHGPAGLLAEGWQFRNQSDPLASGDWRSYGWSHQGRWSLFVDGTVSTWLDDKSEACTWALLPEIPGQAAGHELRFFYTNGSAPPLVPTAHLEIRYSPGGGTSTGSKPEDVGDFTTLLADIPDLETPWSEFRTTVPGGGRLALRFRIPPAAAQSSFWGDFALDDLSVGEPIVGPPLPLPGETVVWTPELSPIEIFEIAEIPAGSTVVVQPGVVVSLGAELTVRGALTGVGLPGTPIVIDGPGRLIVPGELHLEEAVVQSLVQPGAGGTLVLSHVSFAAGGVLSTAGAPTYGWLRPAFVSIEDSSFQGGYMRVGGSHVSVRRTSFQDAFCDVDGWVILDDLTIDGAPTRGLALLAFEQPVFLDNLQITNSAGAGIDAAACNLLLGPNVLLAGNRHPVQLGGAGLLPGTTLPATGNVNDFVLCQDASIATRGGQVWSDVGIPYVVHSSYLGSFTEILEGVNLRLGPGADFWGASGGLTARGTPADPVVIERLDPAQAWHGLQYWDRLEGCVIDGGVVGARFHSSGGTPGYLDDCIVQNCTYGSQNWAVSRKTRFRNNLTGTWNNYWDDSLTGTAGPNSFEGNVVAADANGRLVDAAGNWWGSPTGPMSPDNPEGQGEVVVGPVTTRPFLTEPPDFTDHLPIVHLNEPSWLMEAGEKVILTWTSEDDGALASHRIEFDHPIDGRQVVATLPGWERAYEWTVPDIGFTVNCAWPEVRVFAIDDAGQEGWDAFEHVIPSGEVQGELLLDTPLVGSFLAGSEEPSICWTPVGTNPLGFSITGAIQFDADGTSAGLGGVTSYLSCFASATNLPFISTDTARIRLSLQDGSCNRVKYFFSDPFEIRPDARLGDAAPTVSLLTPRAGDRVEGGKPLFVTWEASDDEGLRAFRLQASYDGGRTWHVLASDLPGDARSYQMLLPPSQGIDDVRVRVIAIDLRFQNSSDGTERVFSIVSGPSSGGTSRWGGRRRP